MSAKDLAPTFIDVFDLLHLDYGLRAGTSKNGLLTVHLMNLPTAHEFPIQQKNQYQAFFTGHQLGMVGYEELSIENGLAHSRWKFFYSDMNSKSANIDVMCSGLKNSVGQLGSAELLRIVKNVVFSVQAMLYRLRDVSTAYGNQASFAVAQGVKPNLQFGNADTLTVFLNIHSFLVEAATLRDHLASFLSFTHFKSVNATSMADLVKQLKKSSEQSAIKEEILQICDEASSVGWLARLAALRNLVVHRAPIVSFGDKSLMKVRSCVVAGVEFTGVAFEVPLDPLSKTNDSKIDALKQCVQIARNMVDFFRNVVAASGIKPELLHFTDSDFK